MAPCAWLTKVKGLQPTDPAAAAYCCQDRAHGLHTCTGPIRLVYTVCPKG
jgi:hypothetical protein